MIKTLQSFDLKQQFSDHFQYYLEFYIYSNFIFIYNIPEHFFEKHWLVLTLDLFL